MRNSARLLLRSTFCTVELRCEILRRRSERNLRFLSPAITNVASVRATGKTLGRSTSTSIVRDLVGAFRVVAALHECLVS